MWTMLTEQDLIKGSQYRWRYAEQQPLIYLRRHKGWHQFRTLASPEVWCEVLNEDLNMMEKIECPAE